MQQKTKLASIIDFITLFLTLFLVTYFIFSKFLTNRAILFCLSIFSSITIFITLLREIKKKQGKLALTQKENKQKDEIMLALKFGDPEKIKNFIALTFGKKYETKKLKTHIELTLNEKNYILVYDFSSTELSHFNLLSLIAPHLKKNKDILIIANTFSEDAKKFSKSSSIIHLIDAHSLYLFFKKVNTFPKTTKIEKNNNLIFSQIKNNINRKNTFKFLRFGLILIAVGHILPFSTYYKISGTILITLSLIALFIKTKSSTQTFFYQP